MKNKHIFVAVIGASKATSEEARLAEEVGKELALRQVTLVCGGMGGVMEAACRGASLNGGLTIGILPGNSREEANPYVQIPIVSSIGFARNIMVVKSAQAVIAIGGAYGTLSEIAYALQSGLPVIALNSWSMSQNGKSDSAVIKAENALEAVTKALDLIN
ncbi:TIGR00725 family protein [Dehalococcoides mccartyi]|uniref:TIGR00725 family protein n=1 Tax=Dehalococcoides mccartyi TaxID=61435 RepID=A0A1S6SGE0_9CHLR|nr:TIGR00725 family protein [Dehalococcoides mccartyi]AQW62226.1 TIGR00725 family protein [Dehalococcoides mccartyi]AQX73030.1 TIGR00725 family protein [Dehalococcoides mccartyi]PKH48068.1 TIGR00725 family protein [Dehalococcoides mccartyi]